MTATKEEKLKNCVLDIDAIVQDDRDWDTMHLNNSNRRLRVKLKLPGFSQYFCIYLNVSNEQFHELCEFRKVKNIIYLVYRVNIQLVANLPLTSEQKFRFGLAWPGLARPKRNFCSEVNGRFATS